MELLFDDEFGLSDGKICEEESEDAYCYCVNACLTKKSLENLVGKLVSDSYGFPLDKPENRSEGTTRVTFQRYIKLDIEFSNKYSSKLVY